MSEFFWAVQHAYNKDYYDFIEDEFNGQLEITPDNLSYYSAAKMVYEDDPKGLRLIRVGLMPEVYSTESEI